MSDRDKIIKWIEYDYLHRVGAYRKDCKQGCDACMPMHDGDDYCDIDMLWKILAILKEQEAVEPKTGHWIYKKNDDMFMCSCCEKYSIRNDYPYCHWCGAKMEGR